MSTQQNDQTSALDAAVSAIYFDDNSDYERALYTVIRHLSPRVWSVIQTDKSAAFKAVRAMVERAERATENKEEDQAELAYWRFDARVKGYSEWKGRPQSERDAFKAEYRAAEDGFTARIAELDTEIERLKASAVAVLPSCDAYLTDQDFSDLHRFVECCEDDDAGGHDVRKDSISRLCKLGVIRHCGFGRHELTAFGWYVHGGIFFQKISLPLQIGDDPLDSTMKGGA